MACSRQRESGQTRDPWDASDWAAATKVVGRRSQETYGGPRAGVEG